MKKRFAVLVILAVVFAMTACGNRNDNEASQQSQLSSTTDDASGSSGEVSGLQDGQESEPAFEDDGSQDQSGSGEFAETESSGQDGTEQGSAEQSVQASGSSILIAYFSRVGNTDWEDGVDATTSASLNVENGEFVGNAEYLARMAQKATGGDLFLIQTQETYPSDYRETTDVAAVEQEENARPALASHVENMDQYDTVVLIYPNWWGTLPQPLFTFLEEYDFSGKTILPLCTHGGSRMGSSERDIARLCPDAVLLDGLAVSGSSASSAQDEVEEWINASGILNADTGAL